MNDTDRQTAAVQLDLYRRMSPARKIELVEEANETARRLALSGLAARHPDADDAELRLRYFHLIHGSELATKVWGSLPEDDAG